MSNTKYMYIRDGKNFPHVCVAWRGQGPGPGGYIEFALATVAPGDKGSFTKARARHIATARLNEGGSVIHIRTDHQSPIVHYILDAVLSMPIDSMAATKAHVTKRAKQLAKAYDIYPLG